MATSHLTGTCLAIALSWSIGAAAQSTSSAQDTEQATPATQSDRSTTSAPDGRPGPAAEPHPSDLARTGEEGHVGGTAVTVVGCLQPEREVFATRGIFNDNVVLTNASAVHGDISAFDRQHEAGEHHEAGGAEVAPYHADRNDMRGETIVQHVDAPERGEAGPVGTSGESAAAVSEARDEPTSAAGVAADRPTSAHDADRQDDQRAKAAPGTTAPHGDRYAEDPEQRTTRTSAIAQERSSESLGHVINLTGDTQQELQPLVGRKVEITGKVSYDEQAAPGRARLAAKPTLEIASFRDMGSCEARDLQ